LSVILSENRHPLFGITLQMSGFEVTRATPADFNEIMRDLVDFWGSERTRGMHNAMYVHELVDTSYVVRGGGKVIAYLFGIIAEPRRVAYAALIGVRGAYKRQGLGQHLYARFEADARSRGCTRLTAVTDPSNERSIAFHTGKVGMRHWVVKDYGGPGQDRVLFEKAI
jgi:ribosomal protein S18 acetylase RimI-like enzyme